MFGEDLQQVLAHVGQPAGRVAELHQCVAVLLDLEPGEEAGHRAAVTERAPAIEVVHLQPEPVGSDPLLVTRVDDHARLTHLRERLGAQQLRAVPAQKRRPPRQGLLTTMGDPKFARAQLVHRAGEFVPVGVIADHQR